MLFLPIHKLQSWKRFRHQKEEQPSGKTNTTSEMVPCLPGVDLSHPALFDAKVCPEDPCRMFNNMDVSFTDACSDRKLELL